MKATIFTLSVLAMILSSLLLVQMVTAQVAPIDFADCQRLGINCPENNNLGPGNPLTQYIGQIITAALVLVGILAVVMIIYGGILYITSQGDTQKAERGKNVVVFAVIGLIVVGLAGAVVSFVIRAIQAN
jgi:hypothetical protein